MEIAGQAASSTQLRMLGKGDNLYDMSGGLDQYKGFVVADIDAIDDTISFTNGVVLEAGEATGDVNEAALRRIQIREAVTAHFEKEQQLFAQGIKVLSLFFIDEVAKYRHYDEAGTAGEYATIFEEEYNDQLQRDSDAGGQRVQPIPEAASTPTETHEGYFSIDKKSKRLVDPEVKAAASRGRIR